MSNEEYSIISSKKLIPSNISIKNADSQLYKKFLAPLKCGLIEEPKWHKFCRYFVSLIFVVYVVKCVTLAILYSKNPEANEKLPIYLGDFAYYIPQIRIHFNIMGANFGTFSFISQLLHLKLSCNCNFAWMEVFLMLAGKRTPYKMGMTNEDDIRRLIKR